MSEFVRSEYFGGAHFVSESTVPSVPFPTVILNRTHWRKNGTFSHIGQVLGSKLMESMAYFVHNSSAPFFVPMTADVYLWVQNIHFLMESVAAQNYTGESTFIWGNCLDISTIFLQGAIYFMSRATARLLLPHAQRWFDSLHTAMDVDFMELLEWVGLADGEITTEHIMAQYLPCEYRHTMNEMNMSVFPSCPEKPWKASNKCKAFEVQYNRLVLLHRLTNCGFREHPVPVYRYSDDLHWSMGWITPRFCMKRSGSESSAVVV
jgi:hypothetical protein